MLQRRRKRKTDPAIAALARELLEYGEFLQQPLAALEGAPLTEKLFARARSKAELAGYWIGVTYCDAVLRWRAGIAEASKFPPDDDRAAAAIKRGLTFGKVIDATGASLHDDAVGTW